MEEMSEQRIALITGASRGIGRACAHALSQAGFKVALAARAVDKLEELAGEIRANGREAYVTALDLASAESIKEAVKKTAVEFGPVGVLVNNGGITKDGLAMRMSREDWDAVIQTNLTGSFLCTQAVIPGMLKARWGRIINIASVVGEMGNAGQANYVASKAGLIGLTKALAREIASRNVTVNAVAAGFIETDMTGVLGEEVKKRLLEAIPLGRMGASEDIAAAVAFLASDAAGYITGHVLDVNGGMYM
jgi:3-oxoacyl-[acyl-carrier protein] reductase